MKSTVADLTNNERPLLISKKRHFNQHNLHNCQDGYTRMCKNGVRIWNI